MTVIAVASSKGGVGKTTTAVSLAASLANLYATTLMDFDAQGQVTLSFGLGVYGGLYNWLIAEKPLPQCLVQGRPDRLQLLPGDSGNYVVENYFHKQPMFDQLVTHLRRACWVLPRLKGEGDGFVVIDTAAGGLLQQAALAVADQVVIPFRPEERGVDGVRLTLENMKKLAPNVQITVLPVAFDTRVGEHQRKVEELQAELVENYADNLGCEVQFAILGRIAVAEADAEGKTIWEYKEKSLEPVRVGYSHLLARVLQLAERLAATP